MSPWVASATLSRELCLLEMSPKGCALFVRNEAGASVVFVSPQFAAIAPQLLKSFAAVECEAPPPRREAEEDGASLMLASHSAFAWSLLGLR
jgi:hypothetical protein